ncbi:MAG TPA: glycosyltransferase family 2 protein [Acidimicrobiales bacterium]|nr:glycosyltransferase family 2 protein [Acidimicrobiales bacterium]
MTTSVIVVSYRPGDWLAPCLASVAGQANQVIAVDNGSDGHVVSDVARRAGADVVRLRRNMGFSGGFNAGLSKARGDVIAVLNDDAVAEPSWLPRAQAALADPTVAAVTPKVLLAGWWGEVLLDDAPWSVPGDARPFGRRLTSVTVDGVEVLDRVLGGGVHRLEGVGAGDDVRPVPWRWSSGGKPFYVPLGEDAAGLVRVNRDPVELRAVCRVLNHAGLVLYRDGMAGEIGLGAPDDGRLDQAADRFGFSGTAPVFRAETLRRLGALAGPFFAYCEDVDWSLRAQLAGLRVVYEPGAVVRHRLSATSGGAHAPHVRYLASRNATLTLVRNAPARVATEAVRARLAPDADPAVRRGLQRRLPWAIASRRSLALHWNLSPAEVWARWADTEVPWDQSPVKDGRSAATGQASLVEVSRQPATPLRPATT